VDFGVGVETIIGTSVYVCMYTEDDDGGVCDAGERVWKGK
jgi:hypothetical protein